MENDIKEQLPVAIVEKVLQGKKVRVAIAQHPVTGELAPCIPYKDLAEVFTYDDATIFKMVQRTDCIKKYSTTSIMEAVDGKFRAVLCLFEEGVYGVTMKLTPSRCKDPEVAAHVDLRQEEMLITLKEAYRGFRTCHVGYDYQTTGGKLPHPGLSMEAVADLCKEADKALRGKASLRALNYFTGMPVDDLVKEIENPDVGSSQLAGVITQYLHALIAGSPERFGIEKGISEEGTEYLEGLSEQFFNAFSVLGRQEKLPKFFKSLVQLGQIMSRESEALELLGWRRSLRKTTRGNRYFRYELIKETVH